MKTALLSAGGTGGHIFPAMAVACLLRERGWQVIWVGGRGLPGHPSMESQLVPKQGFKFEAIDFTGVRGKGLLRMLSLPMQLLRACAQSWMVMRRFKPQVVLVFGGYISVPVGRTAAFMRHPLLVHEQNSVAGMANRHLAKLARRVYSAFPDVLPHTRWIGNPLRKEFLAVASPQERYSARRGPLRMLVLGGSLGAAALNEVVPRALALMPSESRPLVLHQSGQKQIDQLRANYLAAGVQAETRDFIDDTAAAMADADLVLCRAGATTVAEIAAVGVAAVFVPFPSAVDDHQTSNAMFLVSQGAGWVVKQPDLTADRLARMLTKADRPTLLQAAIAARKMAKLDASERIADSCQTIVNKSKSA